MGTSGWLNVAWDVLILEAIVHGSRVLPGLRHVLDRRVWRAPRRSAQLVTAWPLLYLSLCAPFSIVVLLISPQHWVGVLTVSLVWIFASLHDLMRIRRGGNHEDLEAPVFPPTVFENLRHAPWQAWLYGYLLVGAYVIVIYTPLPGLHLTPGGPGVLCWLALPVFGILQRSDGTWGLMLLWQGVSVAWGVSTLSSGPLLGSALGWVAFNAAGLWILLTQPVRDWALWDGKLTSPAEETSVV